MNIEMGYLSGMRGILQSTFSIFSLGFMISLACNAETISVFKNESAIGMVFTGGNSQTQSISVTDQTSYTFDRNTFSLTGNFLRASNFGVESAYHWLLGIRYERELQERISIFLGQNEESDKFQEILQRYNSDIGGKYFFYKEEVFRWFGEAGYRFTRSNYNIFFKNENYARFYTEAERAFTKNMNLKYWLEYLPNLTESGAYKINTELALSAAMSEIFSLRSGYLLRYDNLPISGVPFKTDSTFTTALVAKF